MLLTTEGTPGSPVETDPATAYVLVGFTELRRTLNHVLGFDSNQPDATDRFYEALRIGKQLEQLGVGFPMNYVEGYSATHIKELKRELEEPGPLDIDETFREARIAGMERTLDDLVEDGWLSKPTPKPTPGEE